jgi:hypothetical protein
MLGNFGNLHLVYRGRGNLVNMRAMLLANAERAMVRRSWLSDRHNVAELQSLSS